LGAGGRGFESRLPDRPPKVDDIHALADEEIARFGDVAGRALRIGRSVAATSTGTTWSDADNDADPKHRRRLVNGQSDLVETTGRGAITLRQGREEMT
jgi:hypothetical protein